MGPVLILGNSKKPGVSEAVEESRPLLERDFGIVDIDLSQTKSLELGDAKWALLFGGDGAILNVSRRLGDRALPTLCVNFGRLGFLTEVEYRQLEEALGRVKDERIHLRHRMRLSARIGDWHQHALNDVVLTGLQSGRVFHVSARIGGHDALRYAGDGVVIATPTGSTAYSMAAGGPILDPELNATVITPLCAHALSHRPLVVPGQTRIDLALRDDDDPGGRVVIDGQLSRQIDHGDRLEVCESPVPFTFIRVGIRSHYSRLRRMLGWGGRPKYQG